MASNVLTWLNSGLGTKTGTTIGNFVDDLVTLINSKLGDATYLWRLASSNNGASPQYVALKRKDGSPGRILIVSWASAPAGNNAAILDQTPISGYVYCVWFPSGNTDTPLNLTAASGTILGDDTGCTKVCAGIPVSTIYASLYQPFYFESAEAVYFGFQNPAVASLYCFGAGNILVDGSDNVYGGVFGSSNTSMGSFGSTSLLMPWIGTKPPAGSNSSCCRTNYGSVDRAYFQAWAPSGWASNAVSPTDILSDTGNNKIWFAPFYLIGQVKGEGPVLKLRQLAFGPGTVGAFTAYNTTGPVVAARQFQAQTAGGAGYPWFLNTKI